MQKKMIKSLLYDLVSIQSDTGTINEIDAANYIYNNIRHLDYFEENIDLVGKHMLNDHLERFVVWGLVKGFSKETVILLHHHDVVDSFDYGRYKEFAYNPDELINVFKHVSFSNEIEEDLESGEWIFGRGTADMKAGAAIQMNILNSFSQIENFNGNILLLSVPDEETLSSGMRSAIQLLTELKNKYDLHYKLLINSEPHERVDKDTATYYTGSVGKIMPVVYVKGFKTHIGHIFSGFNPLTILSRIQYKTETNMDFSDTVSGEISPPPSWSFMRDFKEQYDASIPEAAGGYFSVLTLAKTPKEILKLLKDTCEESFQESIDLINKNFKLFQKENRTLNWKSRVFYFEEIYEIAKESGGDIFITDYKNTLDILLKDIHSSKINTPDANFILIKKVLEYMPDNDPIVVIGISPPYYPHVSNSLLALDSKVKGLNNFIENKASTFNQKITKKEYFLGISDLSYTSLNKSDDVIPYIEKNMPLWNEVYHIDFKQLENLDIPIINIGPWGKDYHKRAERVYKDDVFNLVPKLITEVIHYILKSEEE